MNKSLIHTVTVFALLISSQMAWSGQPGQEQNPRSFKARAFYGDKVLDRVVAIDVHTMKLAGTIKTIGSTPYPVDQAGTLDKVYAITRDSESIDVITADTLENLGVIKLDHKPRSGESYNARLGLALIAGANKPLTSVIDVVNDSVVAVAGEDIETVQTRDNGGTLSSGHPAWLSKDRFVVIDRANRIIQLYGIEKIQQGKRLNYRWEVTLLDEVVTPTSVHHVLHRNLALLSEHEKYTFYALSEGSANEGIHPGILKLRLDKNDRLTLEDQVSFDAYEGETYDAAIMSSHHADFHPDGEHIYAGSTEGHLFIIDSLSMTIENVIETGKGTGHTRFVPAKNLAIVTNHHDTFLTVVDNSNENIKVTNITVSGSKKQGQILQSHTNFVSPDSMYYYAFASDNGIFYELDLKSLKITRTLDTGGAPVQGSFINWDYFSYDGGAAATGM